MVDALDTMYIMGLKDEFSRGVRQVEKTMFTVPEVRRVHDISMRHQLNPLSSQGTHVPFFETVIRYLGGYLSAYALSGDRTLLKKADELGWALLSAFETPTGFPLFAVDPTSGEAKAGFRGNLANGWLAEIASCMMEYKYLAKVTGRTQYYRVAENIMQRLYRANVTKYPDGLLPSMWNLQTGEPLSGEAHRIFHMFSRLLNVLGRPNNHRRHGGQRI